MIIMFIIIIIIIIIIIQEISIAHDAELKAGAQSTQRKTLNELQATTAGKVDSPETNNCTSVYKHVIK